jgi:hypothetical protein
VPAPLRARMCVGEERAAIDRLARSRTAPARAVERARIVPLPRDGASGAASGRTPGVCPAPARRRLHRVNRDGAAGLAARPRPGRPPVYRPEEIGEVVAASATDPPTLGLPFAGWTLARLAA